MHQFKFASARSRSQLAALQCSQAVRHSAHLADLPLVNKLLKQCGDEDIMYSHNTSTLANRNKKKQNKTKQKEWFRTISKSLFQSNVLYFMCTFHAGLSIFLHRLSGDCSRHCISTCLYLLTMYLFTYWFIHFCSFIRSISFTPDPVSYTVVPPSTKTKFPHMFASPVSYYIIPRAAVLRLTPSIFLWVFSAFVFLLIPILGSFHSYS